MNIRKKISTVTIATLIAFSPVNSVSVASGIPVVDGAAAMQRTQNFIQEMAEYAKQLVQMKAQLQQAKQQYTSLTGSRNFGAILNNPELRSALPTNWQQVYDNIQKGGYKGLDGTAQAIADAAKLTEKCQYLKSGDSKKACEAQAVQAAQTKAHIGKALEAAQKRLHQIEGLMNQINRTQDPKAIAELQARIGIEQAMIQNESTRLQMYKMMVEANEKMLAEQQKAARATANKKWGMKQSSFLK